MRQSHSVSASFPRWARVGSVVAALHQITNAYRVLVLPLLPPESDGRLDRGDVRCTRWYARLPKLPRRKETWRHRDYVCARVHEYTCACVLACGRVHACVPVVPLGRRVRSPPSFLRSRYTSIFLVRPSSFLSSHSPFSFLPFFCLPLPLLQQHSTRHLCSSAPCAIEDVAVLRVSKYHEIHEIRRVFMVGLRSNTTPDNEEENDDGVVDVLPGQAGSAVRRCIPCACVLSAANKVIIVAGKAPGGKRATSSCLCTRFPWCVLIVRT